VLQNQINDDIISLRNISTPKELRKKYLELLLKYHPDINQNHYNLGVENKQADQNLDYNEITKRIISIYNNRLSASFINITDDGSSLNKANQKCEQEVHVNEQVKAGVFLEGHVSRETFVGLFISCVLKDLYRVVVDQNFFCEEDCDFNSILSLASTGKYSDDLSSDVLIVVSSLAILRNYIQSSYSGNNLLIKSKLSVFVNGLISGSRNYFEYRKSVFMGGEECLRDLQSLLSLKDSGDFLLYLSVFILINCIRDDQYYDLFFDEFVNLQQVAIL